MASSSPKVRNEKRFHKQALEEIRILKHLRNQDKENTMNIIHMYESFVFRNHMCITFELLSVNLYELIKKNKFQGFSIQLVRRFAFSMLKCLEALYNNKIIHCDLKPGKCGPVNASQCLCSTAKRCFFLLGQTRKCPPQAARPQRY